MVKNSLSDAKPFRFHPGRLLGTQQQFPESFVHKVDKVKLNDHIMRNAKRAKNQMNNVHGLLVDVDEEET